jgi:ABC-type phosphate/phosphonate transport system ATPase subunit
MGFLFRPKELPRPASLTFTLDQAGHTYDDGHVGLAPTDITISELRVAVIGLNGAGSASIIWSAKFAARRFRTAFTKRRIFPRLFPKR